MGSKLDRYGRLREQIAGLIDGIESPVARRATAAALDLDSRDLGRVDDTDREGLEAIVRLLEEW